MKDIHDVISRLSELPREIEEAESKFFATVRDLDSARRRLFEVEANLILNNQIKGRNEKERASEMLPHTKKAYREVVLAEIERDVSKVTYHRLKREFEAVKSIALILGDGQLMR